MSTRGLWPPLFLLLPEGVHRALRERDPVRLPDDRPRSPGECGGMGEALAAEALSAAGRQRPPGHGGDGHPRASRSEARRVGEKCVSTCRSRGAPVHEKKKKNN